MLKQCSSNNILVKFIQEGQETLVVALWFSSLGYVIYLMKRKNNIKLMMNFGK